MSRKEPSHVDAPAIQEIDKILKSLDRETLTAMEWDEFDVDTYQTQANYQGPEMGPRHAAELLRQLQDDLDLYKRQQKKKNLGLTVPKLLVRYLKLPQIWKAYILTRIGIESGFDSSDEGPSVRTDVSPPLSDDRLFLMFAGLEAESKGKYQRTVDLLDVLEVFDQTLSEVEEATAFSA